MKSILSAQRSELGWMIELFDDPLVEWLESEEHIWFDEDEGVLVTFLGTWLADWIVANWPTDAKVISALRSGGELALVGVTTASAYSTGFLERLLDRHRNGDVSLDDIASVMGPLARDYIEQWSLAELSPVYFEEL